MGKTIGDNVRRNNKTLSTIIQEKNGYIRTKDLQKKGFHHREIKLMVEEGTLLKLKSGLYRQSDIPLIANQNFIDISIAVPKGVICLLSALSFYGLTTFNPTYISIALVRNTWKPEIKYPPVEFNFFKEKQFNIGIDEIKIGKHKVRIFSLEKTACDCFRLRNKIGVDITKEGITEYLKRKDRDIEKLLKYAEVCRVKNTIETWLNIMI